MDELLKLLRECLKDQRGKTIELPKKDIRRLLDKIEQERAQEHVNIVSPGPDWKPTQKAEKPLEAGQRLADAWTPPADVPLRGIKKPPAESGQPQHFDIVLRLTTDCVERLTPVEAGAWALEHFESCDVGDVSLQGSWEVNRNGKG